jgi:outer membrane protein
MTSKFREFVAASACVVALTLAASPAQAIDLENKRVRIGIGAQVVPSFPGSEDFDVLPWIDPSIADQGEVFEFEAPDESFGISLLGDDSPFGIGPVLNFESARKPKDIDDVPLHKVDFTVEAGVFADYDISPNFRLRAEGRRGVGGHDGWIGTLSADYIARDGDEWLFSVGPRLNLADDNYHDEYFGVTAADAVATTLPAYDPDGGILSYGAAASLLFSLTESWGVMAYAKYDRLTGDAADSPIVRELGSRSQLSGGLGITYTFTTGGGDD